MSRPEDMWTWRGQARPAFAVPPGPGQESVWDYPRPPVLVPDPRRVEVHAPDGRLLVATTRAQRLLETASPPTFYLPPDELAMDLLVRVAGRSLCEWKGEAGYWALKADSSTPVAWSYEAPRPAFAAIRGWIAFYPDRVACTVAGELVRPQPGRFYGGWITSELVGPFKGDPGSGGW